MRTIENYYDFFSAMRDKQSEDRVVRNEAKNALGNFHRRNPELFDEFTKRFEGIEEPEPIVQAKPRKPRKTAADKEQFIREHPELSVNDLRDKARARLMKGRYGLGLAFDIPVWISQEAVLKTIDTLTISDLITASGNLVQRETLLRKCMRIVIDEGNFDEEKLRKTAQNMFISYYDTKQIALNEPIYREPVRRMLYENTSIEELLYIANNGNGPSIDVGRLVDLINRKKVVLTEKDIRRYQKKEAKRSKNAEKRAKRIAEREAAIKRASEIKW